MNGERDEDDDHDHDDLHDEDHDALSAALQIRLQLPGRCLTLRPHTFSSIFSSKQR